MTLGYRAAPGWNWPGRVRMTLFAAFLIALPFLPALVIGGTIGLAIWATLFVPAVLGIALVQLPLKTALIRRGWRDRPIRWALLVVNTSQTVGLFAALGGDLPWWVLAVLAIVAALAVLLWTALDDHALGATRYDYLMEAS